MTGSGRAGNGAAHGWTVVTGGERLRVLCEPDWLVPVLDGVLDAGPAVVPDGGDAGPERPADLVVTVQAGRAPFVLPGRVPVTRGAWSDGSRVLVEDACSSGFDLLVDATDVVAGAGGEGQVRVLARYRPPVPTRALNLVLRNRFWLLARQTLVHYPVFWRAGLRGRVPLHASAFAPAATAAAGTPGGPAGTLLIGPGGIGKSTLLLAQTAAGARPASDNLCVWGDGTAYGVVEPVRVEGGTGRRSTHGRRERPLPGRVPQVSPERLVLLQRGPVPGRRPVEPQDAARALVAGTYSAGELRRYWGLAAVLALGTGAGPAHPPVAAVADRIAAALPCEQVCLDRPGDRLPEASDQWEGVS